VTRRKSPLSDLSGQDQASELGRCKATMVGDRSIGGSSAGARETTYNAMVEKERKEV
jgi:hypothetical protein